MQKDHTNTSYHNLEIACHDHGAARKELDDTTGCNYCSDLGARGLKKFVCTVFQGRTWLNILYLLTFAPAWGFFCFGWTLGAFIAAACTFWVFPIGTAISSIFAVSWRALASGEIAITNWVAEKEVDVPEALVTVTTSPDQHCCCWPARAFVAVYTQLRTYTILLYYLLLKFPISLSTLIITAVSLAVSLGLMFNFIILASCDVCYSDTDNDFVAWTLGTYQGSLVTIPVGFLLLVLSCNICNAFVFGTTWLSRACLQSEKKADSADKVFDRCPHCDRPVPNYPSTSTVAVAGQSRTEFGPTQAVDFDPESQTKQIQQRDSPYADI